jgi:hypothetical protein
MPANKEAVLANFGGLYTEAEARSFPAGASPLCYDCDFDVGSVGIRPGLISAISQPPAGTAGYQWLKSASLPGSLSYNVYNDTLGNLWYEDLASPGSLTKFYSGIVNGARAISASFPNREYIGLSNLVMGTDQPRQWDGTNLDRISQVGPGAGPTVPPQAPPAIYGVSSIIQPYAAQTIDSAVWGAYINEYNAPPSANSLWIMGAAGAGLAWLGDVKSGDYIYISGMGNLEGQNPNGTYQVAGTGFFTDATGTKPYILVITAIAVSDFARGTAGGTYQKTQAVLTISNAIPLLAGVVGLQFTIASATPISWNQLWTITATPTVGQLNILATQLTSNVATYTYSLVSGNAPAWQPANEYVMASTIIDSYGHVWQTTTPGLSGSTSPFPASPAPGATQTDGAGTLVWTYQAGQTIPVTIFGTSNGNGVFNVSNAIITSAVNDTFNVTITSQNYGPVGEQGSAVAGLPNVLVFDPGEKTLHSGAPGTDPIYSNASAGGLVIPASTTQVASGQRYAVLLFRTRNNNSLMPASPPVGFLTTGASSQLTFNDCAIGPPNVLARIIAITAANSLIGGPYFYVPQDVYIPASAAQLGQPTTYGATIIPDNVSTSLTVTISDTVLLNGINISEVGNNLFNQREIGEFVKCVNYFGRNFVIGERVKVNNFVNMTFDGGGVSFLPAGWTISNSLAPDVSLVASPIVNQSLYINNVAAPKIVQSASNTVGGAPSISATFPAIPTTGNTLIFMITGPDGGADYVPPAGLTSEGTHVNTFTRISLYKRTVAGGDPATWTFTPPFGYSQNMFLAIYELPGTPIITPTLGAVSGTAPTMQTAIISPSGTNLVFCMFNMYGAFGLASVSPAPYADILDLKHPTYPIPPDAVSVVFGSGLSLPSSAITAVTNTGGAGITYGILACAYSATSTILNPIGTTLANMATLSQPAYQDVFLAPIIDPNTAYSLRVTAAIPSGNTNGSMVIELYSPSLATNWSFTVPFSSMGTSIQEFVGAFNNPLWGTPGNVSVPNDLLFRVYPFNMAAGADLLIDRIEPFPTIQPVYATQCNVSYAQNFEAIDAITGTIDTSNFTSEAQTDIYVFLETLYIKTASKTFALNGANQSGECSTWNIREVSNTVGSAGPLCNASNNTEGEQYTLDATQKGAFIFDGGNHTKISQEIYKVWDLIYQPAVNTIWVKNDILRKRIMIGVPLPTPNKWLPNAPTNATPSVPNVILMCRYTGLDSGSQIAEGHAVTVSFMGGHLIYKDGRRKWTIWQIASPYADFLPRSDSSTQFVLGGAAGTGQINQLDSSVKNDNGNVIDQTYFTYGFADKATEQELQLGSVRKLWTYATANLSGDGNADISFILERPDSSLINLQQNFPLQTVPTDDVNIDLNENGNALYVKFSVDGKLNSNFTLQRLVLLVGRDPWLPVTGA